MGVEGGNARFGIIFSVPATCLPRHPLHSSQPTSTKLSYQPLPTLLLYLSISSYLRALPQRGADQLPGAGSPAKCQHGRRQPPPTPSPAAGSRRSTAWTARSSKASRTDPTGTSSAAAGPLADDADEREGGAEAGAAQLPAAHAPVDGSRVKAAASRFQR